MQSRWATYRPIDWTPLLAATPPWAHLVCCSEREIDHAIFQATEYGLLRYDTFVRTIRAVYCRTASENYMYWSAALQFPGWYQPYWLAFRDCIEDTTLLGEDFRVKRILIVVTDADRLLISENDDNFELFLEALDHAASEWAKPWSQRFVGPGVGKGLDPGPIPFHVLFQCEYPQVEETQHRYARAGVKPVPVSFVPATEESSLCAAADDLIAIYIEPHSTKPGISNYRLKEEEGGYLIWAIIGDLAPGILSEEAVMREFHISREALDAVLAFYGRHREIIDARIILNRDV